MVNHGVSSGVSTVSREVPSERVSVRNVVFLNGTELLSASVNIAPARTLVHKPQESYFDSSLVRTVPLVIVGLGLLR